MPGSAGWCAAHTTHRVQIADLLMAVQQRLIMRTTAGVTARHAVIACGQGTLLSAHKSCTITTRQSWNPGNSPFFTNVVQ
jgi:hypothetical protein